MNFEDKIKEEYKLKFDSIKLSDEIKNKVLNETINKKSFKNRFAELMNYEFEISLNKCIAVIVCICIIPTFIYFINVKKAEVDFLKTKIISKSIN